MYVQAWSASHGTKLNFLLSNIDMIEFSEPHEGWLDIHIAGETFQIETRPELAEKLLSNFERQAYGTQNTATLVLDKPDDD